MGLASLQKTTLHFCFRHPLISVIASTTTLKHQPPFCVLESIYKMALRLLPFAPATMSRSLLSESLQFPRLARFLPITPIATSGFLQPVSISLNIPSLLSDLWDSVLRAVPKKKTSHMKKRHRQMAGKALKDVKSLNKCPGCGQVKRAHLLCPNCVKGRI